MRVTGMVMVAVTRRILAARGIAGYASCHRACRDALRLAYDQHQGNQNDQLRARHSNRRIARGCCSSAGSGVNTNLR
jgi:hypothetical protein